MPSAFVPYLIVKSKLASSLNYNGKIRKGLYRMEEVSIIIPAYNEKEGIVRVIESLRLLKEKHGQRWEIIVVDDGSTDNTPEMVRKFEDVILIQHPLNRGYGAAIKTGMRHAKYNTLVISDADGTYPVSDIPKLIAQLSKSDMVVGARHIVTAINNLT